MIYLIGGPPRLGKSTLAKRVRESIVGQSMNGDALAASLHAFLKPEWKPDIFDDVVDPYKDQLTNQAKVDRIRRRDAAVWQFHRLYLEELQRIARDNIIFDGLVWPDFLHDLQLEHRAVFLVDTSPDQGKRLIEIRDDNEGENNWMRDRDYSDERIMEWVSFSIERSRVCIELCNKHGYAYFDIADHGIEKAQQLAFEHLLNKKV
jgi:hypothetical protein